jgi:hypothetical protein
MAAFEGRNPPHGMRPYTPEDRIGHHNSHTSGYNLPRKSELDGTQTAQSSSSTPRKRTSDNRFSKETNERQCAASVMEKNQEFEYELQNHTQWNVTATAAGFTDAKRRYPYNVPVQRSSGQSCDVKLEPVDLCYDDEDEISGINVHHENPEMLYVQQDRSLVSGFPLGEGEETNFHDETEGIFEPESLNESTQCMEYNYESNSSDLQMLEMSSQQVRMDHSASSKLASHNSVGGDMSAGRKNLSMIEVYDCRSCGRQFNSQDVFMRHMASHSADKPYTEVHTGDEPYTEVHTGDKPYTCGICAKSFRRSTCLTRHQRQHTGEKPYKCQFCSKQFSDGGNLIKHMRRHAAEQS